MLHRARSLSAIVFYNKAPLHDGAMVIRDGKVYAAACILPLSQNPGNQHRAWHRHRAALGMSENSDAMVVVVSEETGSISVAEKGVLLVPGSVMDREGYLRIGYANTPEVIAAGLDKMGEYLAELPL